MNQLPTSFIQPRDVLDAELKPHLDALETQRQEATSKVKLWGGLCALLWVPLVAGSVLLRIEPFVTVVLIVVGVGAIGWIYTSALSGYRETFKAQIMSRLVQFVGPGLAYVPRGFIQEHEFKESQLFSRDPDRYSGDDLVHGAVGATQVRFSEIDAEYKTTSTNSKGQTTTHWHTIFEGLFFRADFNKHFHGQTIVLPDTAEKMFGGFGQSLQSFGANFSNRELCRMDDPDFERAFVVYATDPVEARYILTPAMMRRLLELKARHGSELFVSFVGAQVNIAIPRSQPMFEPPVWSPVNDPKLVSEFVADLQMALGIVHELDLNTRIWTK